MTSVALALFSEHVGDRAVAFGGGQALPETGLVFTNERGRPIQQHPFSMLFGNACRKARLPPWATPHDLRHFYASTLIRAGASIKVVQTRLGHASAKVTLDVYGHLFRDEDDRTRQAIDTALVPDNRGDSTDRSAQNWAP